MHYNIFVIRQRAKPLQKPQKTVALGYKSGFQALCTEALSLPFATVFISYFKITVVLGTF
jgi:hypothetical protein